MSIVNIARNALRPGYAREMARKLGLRLRDRNQAAERVQAIQWCHENQSDAVKWGRSLDPSLWSEAEAFAEEQRQLADQRAKQTGQLVGGAGFYPLLHFLTRYLRPNVVVETGVAFGFSSRAFLHALRENGLGHLYSSDFPYFRQSDPERLIGSLVESDLRERWTLLIGSDRDNLPRIAEIAGPIDLLHYDSDKSYSGRAFALETFGPCLASQAMVLFDDIQDNWHFRDWTEASGANRLVFEFKGKWIGLTGGPARMYQ